MNWIPYLKIARPDHWFKNIFILPGCLVAVYFDPTRLTWALLPQTVMILSIACMIASSYYVFNEILDAPFDAHHPVKKDRPIPSGQVRLPLAWTEWVVLSIVSLTSAFLFDMHVGLIGLLLWCMGLLYNLPPIRLKDAPYLDVLSESLNNPLRLALGWYATGLAVMPPLSLLLAYWMFGAFLMAAKRFAEYRQIADPERAARYRESFKFYNEERLLISLHYYATAFALLGGFFIARYDFELILAAPLIAYSMAYYLHIAFKPNSAAQYTENLYRERKLVFLVVLNVVVFFFLFFITWPWLRHLFDPHILPPP